LVIARARPDLEVVLVDRRAARADHLRRLVGRLDLGDRVRVLACDAGRLPSVLPGLVDAVVARGFAAPAETARRAAALVRPGGLVVVSEPPHRATDRWPAAELAELGLQRVPSRDARVACFYRRGHVEVPRES
jgi:16S rRNA (guanine527-N7)-methyltransferase